MIALNNKTIVLTGGGTAGHVLPHLALLPYLKKGFKNIYYIGGVNDNERRIVEKEGVKFFPVNCAKFRRGLGVKNIVKDIMIPVVLLKSIRSARKILKELKPDIVFSKGGFVALPVVRAAKSLKIPVVAHESDVSLGLANRLSVSCCEKICTTFKVTAEKSKNPKFVYTGSPIRQKIYQGNRDIVSKRHDLGIGKNLLVLGGSLGAAKINQCITDAAKSLVEEFNVIHICGKGKTSTKFVHARYVQIEFAEDIENYLAWSDIVVSRAGSNTLCELMVLGKPTLFIPLATGRGDQIENVKEVLRYNAARVLYEKDLSVFELTNSLLELDKNRDYYIHGSRNVIKDGTEDIYNTIYSVVCKTYNTK